MSTVSQQQSFGIPDMSDVGSFEPSLVSEASSRSERSHSRKRGHHSDDSSTVTPVINAVRLGDLPQIEHNAPQDSFHAKVQLTAEMPPPKKKHKHNSPREKTPPKREKTPPRKRKSRSPSPSSDSDDFSGSEASYHSKRRRGGSRESYEDMIEKEDRLQAQRVENHRQKLMEEEEQKKKLLEVKTGMDMIKLTMGQALYDEIHAMSQGEHAKHIPNSAIDIKPTMDLPILVNERTRIASIVRHKDHAKDMTDMFCFGGKMIGTLKKFLEDFDWPTLGLEYIHDLDKDLEMNRDGLVDAFNKIYTESGPIFELSGTMKLFKVLALSLTATIAKNGYLIKKKKEAEKKEKEKESGEVGGGGENVEEEDHEPPPKRQKTMVYNEIPKPTMLFKPTNPLTDPRANVTHVMPLQHPPINFNNPVGPPRTFPAKPVAQPTPAEELASAKQQELDARKILQPQPLTPDDSVSQLGIPVLTQDALKRLEFITSKTNEVSPSDIDLN